MHLVSSSGTDVIAAFITVPCTLQPLLLVLPFRTVHDFDKKAGQGFTHLLHMISDPYIESPVYAIVHNLSRPM